MDNNNNNFNQQPFNQQFNPQYNQPYQNNYGGDQLEKPLTLGNWIVIMLLMLIPCVNIILLFIWAFGHTESKSKKNYARAMLIFYAAGIVLSLIFSSILMSMINSITNSYYY